MLAPPAVHEVSVKNLTLFAVLMSVAAAVAFAEDPPKPECSTAVFYYNGPASLAHAPVKVDGKERHRMRQLFSLPVSAGHHVIGTNEHKRDATAEFTCGQSRYFRLIG